MCIVTTTSHRRPPMAATRAILLTAFAVGALFSALADEAACETPATKPRPNIILLYADDWRNDTLGAAGHPVVKTPHLDALAESGVRFTHSYVTTSICSISRASLLTGQWMSRHGCRAFRPFETPWKDTLVAMLRGSGYQVAHVGKWHNGRFPTEHYDHSVVYHGKHWYKLDGKSTHVTVRNQRDAISFLRSRDKNQPFFLHVSFFAPHAEDPNPQQYLPQDWSESHYEGAVPEEPVNNTLESWRRLPPFFSEENEGRKRWKARFDTPAKYRSMLTNYFRLVTEVDHACGAILDELSQQGEREDTLVIFTADNGYYHGEHGLADKWYPHEESIRVPLIIDDPRLPEAVRGTTRPEMVLNVDLAPTILAAAGIDPPRSMQGAEIAPLYLAGGRDDWRTDFFYEHPTHRNASFIPASEALVTKDWKYLYWPEQKYEQLFDLRADPHEEQDLARSPQHKERLTQMKSRFQELKEDSR